MLVRFYFRMKPIRSHPRCSFMICFVPATNIKCKIVKSTYRDFCSTFSCGSTRQGISFLMVRGCLGECEIDSQCLADIRRMRMPDSVEQLFYSWDHYKRFTNVLVLVYEVPLTSFAPEMNLMFGLGLAKQKISGMRSRGIVLVKMRISLRNSLASFLAFIA